VLIALAVVGPFIGSFFNVLIYRLPRGEEVVVRKSHCPKCEAPIRWFDNIPIVSFIALRGKCRDCGSPISLRYPVIELATAVLFVITFHLASQAGYVLYPALLVVGCAAVLFLVLVIDIETYLIPDQLIWWGLLLSILLLIIGGSPSGGWGSAIIGFFALSLLLIIIGAIANAVVFPETFRKDRGFLVIFPWLWYITTYIIAYPIEHFRGLNRASPDEVLDAESATAEKSAMGGGDIKLAMVMGLFLGWKLLIAAFAFAILTGGLVAVVMLIVKRTSGQYKKGLKLQFGPFLSLGCYAAVFLGDSFIAWYLAITGLSRQL